RHPGARLKAANPGSITPAVVDSGALVPACSASADPDHVDRDAASQFAYLSRRGASRRPGMNHGLSLVLKPRYLGSIELEFGMHGIVEGHNRHVTSPQGR